MRPSSPSPRAAMWPRRAASFVLAALAALAATRAHADDGPPADRLALAAEYARFPELVHDTLAPPAWLRDDRFIYWAATGPHRGTFVLVDPARRTQEPLLAADALAAQVGAALANPRIVVTRDQRRLLFRAGPRRFALGLDDRRLVPLADDDREAAALAPEERPAPDGRLVARPRRDGFVIVDGARTRVERRGERDYAWQLPAAAWSPDGRYLAVWRRDTRAVHKLPIVDYASALEKVDPVPYVKSGTPLARAELYLVEPATGRVRAVALPAAGESAGKREGYAEFAGWRPDGSEAVILRLSRDGKQLDLLAVAAASGRARLVLREERPSSFVAGLDFSFGAAPTYVPGWATQLTPLADNRRFLWLSERDGRRHVYCYDWSGRLERQVTRGPFVVHEVVGAPPGGDTVLLLASAEGPAPYDWQLYRAQLNGPNNGNDNGANDGGDMQPISTAPGVHRVTLSPSGRFYIDRYSSRTQPRLWETAPSDGSAPPFRYAAADAGALAPLHLTPPEPIVAHAADGQTRLHGVLYKPWDFDARKRYAVIDYIYGGPFTNEVPWSFIGTADAAFARALAQVGFVVLVVDARGTPGRDKAFQDVTYGRIGQLEIPDHVAVLRELAATRPYIDLGRAGIAGHSWGGYFTLRGMLTAPEFYKAGYAGAPGSFEEDALVNEPYLGLPADNPAAYAAGSNPALAKNLRGALKIMHGTSDTSASLSATMRMADALIRAGKRFDLLIMPGVDHSPAGAAGRYYREDQYRFFWRTLGGPR